jgi:hypothetical protein
MFWNEKYFNEPYFSLAEKRTLEQSRILNVQSVDKGELKIKCLTSPFFPLQMFASHNKSILENLQGAGIAITLN